MNNCKNEASDCSVSWKEDNSVDNSLANGRQTSDKEDEFNEIYHTIEKQQLSANYLQPTLSSSLPPFAQGEVERVRSSYRTGSFWSIKRLPVKLKPGQVQLSRKQQTVENLISHSGNVFKPASKGGDVFHPQIYVATDYDKVSNLNKNAVEEEKIIVDSYSRKPFVVTSRVRAKNEDIFFDPEYRFPHMGGGTGVFRLESITRSDILHEDRSFNQSLSAKKVALVREWLRTLYGELSRDWPEFLFKVRFVPETSELLVQFERPNRERQYVSLLCRNMLNTKPTSNNGTATEERGEPPSTANPVLNALFPPPNNLLGRYMQRLATHGAAYKFNLKKRGDRWNVYEAEVLEMADGDTIPTADSTDMSQQQQQQSEHGCIVDHHRGSESRDHLPALRSSSSKPSGLTNAVATSSPRQPSTPADDELNWHVPGTGSAVSVPPTHSPPGGRRGKTVNFAGGGGPNLGKSSTSLGEEPMQTVVVDLPPAFRQQSSSNSVLSFGNPNGQLSDTNGDDQSVGSHSTVSAAIGQKPSHEGSGEGSYVGGSASRSSSLLSDASAGGALRADLALVDPCRVGDEARFEDDKVYLLTYSFYAPWVTTGLLAASKQAAEKHRQQANSFGVKLRKKYSLDSRPEPQASAAAASTATVTGSDTSKFQKPILKTGSSRPLLGSSTPSVMSGSSAQHKAPSAAQEPDEMSFGTHGSGEDEQNRLARGSPSVEQMAVARAVAQMGISAAVAAANGEAGGLRSASGGKSGSGGAQRGQLSRMSTKRSLRSFSKSSFSQNNTLIFD